VTAFGFAAFFIPSIVALGLFTALHAARIDRRFPAIGGLVELDGGVVHVVEASAQGEERGVVLLLHGASGNHADMMQALGPPLSALGFRVLAVDRPGYGWTSRFHGRRAASPSLQGELIRAALARRSATRAIVVGHSLGAVTALALALDAPDFVRALVLLSPVSHPWPGGVDWYYKLSALPLIGPLFRSFVVMPVGLLSLRAGVNQVFTPNPTPLNYVEATALKLVLHPRRFRANAEDVVALKPFVVDLSQRYGQLVAPTEIVTGDTDGVVSPQLHAAGCARDIPGAALAVLPGVGHSPHHASTESVVAAILRAEERALAKEAVPVDAKLAAAG
jgi:pimeloyl-ACP methyl ester carboxylesterase